MKKITSFKIIAVLFACFLFANAKSQCSANFSFNINSNGNVSFTNLSTPNIAFATYTWSFGDSQWSNQVNPSHTYASNGNYIVTLQRFDTASFCSVTYTAAVNINNTTCNVNAGFTFSTNPNGTINFINTSTGTIPSTLYYLQYGDNTTSSFPNNGFVSTNHTYTTTGTYIATLTAFNSSVSCFDSYTASINVTSQPTICALSANFTYTVNNGTVFFNNLSTGTTSTTTYWWNFGNSTSMYAQNPPSQTYPGNGTYTITLFLNDSLNNCSSTITNTISITNAPCIATANFSMAKDTTVLPSIVWNAFPTYPANVSSVVWNWGDNTSSTGLYPSHTYSATGFYNICLTVSVSCGSSTTTCINQNIFKSSNNMQMATVNVLSASPTGLAKNNVLADAIRIYPNPVKDVLTIESDAADLNISIIDIYGKTVYSGTRSSADSKLDVQNLNSGIYFVKLSGTNFSKTVKIVKN